MDNSIKNWYIYIKIIQNFRWWLCLHSWSIWFVACFFVFVGCNVYFCVMRLRLFYVERHLIKINLFWRPTTNAIMGLTVANYILQPFFSGDCGVPTLAAQLMAAALICKVIQLMKFEYFFSHNFLIGFLTFVNCYDVKSTTKMQNVFMFTKIGALVLVIILGIYWMAIGTYECFLYDNVVNWEKIFLFRKYKEFQWAVWKHWNWSGQNFNCFLFWNIFLCWMVS